MSIIIGKFQGRDKRFVRDDRKLFLTEEFLVEIYFWWMDVDFEGKFVCDLYNSTSTSIILIVLMIRFFFSSFDAKGRRHF